MSVLFPRFRPSEREFTPGVLPQTIAETESQRTVRKPLASKAGGALLELVFANIPDSEAQQIQATHTATLGTFDTLQLPGELFAGDPELEAFILEIGGLWRFLEAPTIEWAKKGRCTVRVRLLSYRDSSRVVGPPVVPPLSPETPEEDPPEVIGPPLPDGPPPDWGNPVQVGSLAYFLVQANNVDTLWTTGEDDYEWARAGGIVNRIDGAGYVMMTMTDGVPDEGSSNKVWFACRDLDGAKVWQAGFSIPQTSQRTRILIATPTGYLGVAYYAPVSGPDLNSAVYALLTCDAQGQNAEVHEYIIRNTQGIFPYFELTRAQMAQYNDNITAALIGTDQIASAAELVEGNVTKITDEPLEDLSEWIYVNEVWDIRRIETEIRSVEMSSDGSIWLLLSGEAGGRAANTIIKLNPDFTIAWEKRITIQDPYEGTFSFIAKTNDDSGDMLMSGSTSTFGPAVGSSQTYATLARIKDDGAVVWLRNYRGNEPEVFDDGPYSNARGTSLMAIGELADGTIVTAGWTSGRIIDPVDSRIDAVTLTAYTSDGIPKNNSQRVFIESQVTKEYPVDYGASFYIPTNMKINPDGNSLVLGCEGYGGQSAMYFNTQTCTLFTFRYEPATAGLNFVVEATVEVLSYREFPDDSGFGFPEVASNNGWAFLIGPASYGPGPFLGYSSSNIPFGATVYAAPIADLSTGVANGVYGVDRKSAYSILPKDVFYIQSTQIDSPVSYVIEAPARLSPYTPLFAPQPVSVPEKLFPFLAPPSLTGAVPVVKEQITYSQSSVYPGNAAATLEGMQNDIGEELLETATDAGNYDPPIGSWVKMDLGVNCIVNTIYIGADTTGVLAGGWGAYYTQFTHLQYSVDDINWFPVTMRRIPEFFSPIKIIPDLNIAARYIRLWTMDYVAVTEFYATTT